MPDGVKSREARLGIVMYGGVSLAIYINGVGQELFRAVQGSGIYKLLKAVLDTDIVVDIVSGTSAGGINGLFLAYSLLNGKDFTQTKNLWREHGDFSRLLHRVDLEPDDCKSLLNSDEYYRARMKEAFEELDTHPFNPAGSDPSHMQEMDLFITGTSFYPDVYTTFDDAGRPIDMLEYRKVFRLKHRAGREKPGPFTAAGADREVLHQALAKLARITSCFPAAFLPVRVLNSEDWTKKNPRDERPFLYLREPEVDQKLCEWGTLTKSAYFMDGGLLNNKPFTPTIKAIFSRTADRPVDRVLFYVEPDPEKTDDGPICEPTFLSAVLNGTIGISTYQSTTDDAKLLEEHNSEVIRHNAVLRELKGKFDPATMGTGVRIPRALTEPQRSLYINARNVQLASRALRGALRNNSTGEEPHLTSAADRERVKQLFQSLNQTRQTDELSYDQTFERFDIYFRLRRLHHICRQIYCTVFDRTPAQEDPNRRLLQGLNRHIHLLEIVQYWIEYAIDRAPVNWKTTDPNMDPWDCVWCQISCLLGEALQLSDDDRQWLPRLDQGIEDYLSAISLDQFHKSMHDRIHALLDRYAQGIPVRDRPKYFYGLLQWADVAEEAFIQRCRNSSEEFDKFRKEYTQFVNLDAVVFPPDFLSNLRDFNEVRLMRIGPSPSLDETGQNGIGFWATRGAEEKLAGRGLAHFSGFLKRSWRSNDILWGRLDGLRHLVITLLSSDRIAQLRRDPILREKIRQNLGAGGMRVLVTEVFPDSPLQSQRQLANFFDRVLGANDVVISPDELKTNLNLLVEMGQLQVLYEELGGVLRDAATQQAEWNTFQRPAAQAAAMPAASFLSPVGYTDPSLVALHAENEIAAVTRSWKAEAPTALKPKKTPIGEYFENSYDIAGEGLEGGLPPLVVAQYVTQSALVTNNCMLGSMKKPLRDRVTGNLIYKLGIRLPLQLSHRFIGLWIRAPKTIAITLTFVIAAALVALAIVIFWHNELLNKQTAWTTWLVLVALPIGLLIFGTRLLRGLLKQTDY